MSAQFKMLRLEACLAGEALETIKGLGYSKAAKLRLLTKYVGNRREIQCHVDELIKLNLSQLERKIPKNWKNLQTCWRGQ